MSTRVLSIAGLTMAKVGKGVPVSYSAHTPVGSMTLPASSKHTVTILYVPSHFWKDEDVEGEISALPWEDLEGEEALSFPWEKEDN